MKDFRGTVLAAAKNQLAPDLRMAWIFEVEVPTSPPTRFRLTSNADAIQRGVNTTTGEPLVWSPYPIAVGNLTENAKGDLKGCTVNIGNATQELLEELEAYGGLVDQPAVIRLVPADGPYEPSAERRYDGLVTGVTLKQNVLVVTIGQPNLQKRQFPTHRFLADHCGVRQFGGVRCGYSIPAGATNAVGGGFDFCPMTLAGCEERGDDEEARGLARQHPRRFDNCPGIKQSGGSK